ncbi:MAG TPA: transposase [Pyrinomonadaceae bacterium]|nr:transposase [Pyrinomonadaceae bacterium]
MQNTLRLVRPTYPQNWSAYNQAQTNEKALFQTLLHELCEGVGEPSQVMGRPRLPLNEMIFAAAFKVFSTVSGRRFMSDLRDAHAKGYISKLPCYNSIFTYFENEVMTAYLTLLVEESSLPLRVIERDFAVDSSGFSTGVYKKWAETKWTGVRVLHGAKQPNTVKTRDWVKVHICCGVKTNVITAIEVTHAHANDHDRFQPLVEATSQNFVIDTVSADKAYSSYRNVQYTFSKAAMPYIDFKHNTKVTIKSPAGWRRMFHLYSYNKDEFMRQYHKRSNVETTFAMMNV